MSPSIEWVSGDDSESEGPRDEQLAVLADHSVCLAAHVSGGLKSHSTRGPGSISKGGGNASLAEVLELRRAGRPPRGGV